LTLSCFGPFLHLETYTLAKHFEQWNSSQQMKNVINESKIAKINQQSADAVYYHIQQTGLSMAAMLTTGTSKRNAVYISKIGCSCGFSRKSLFLVEMPSNSLPPLEAIESIVV